MVWLVELTTRIRQKARQVSVECRTSRTGKFGCFLKGVDIAVETTPCFNMVKNNHSHPPITTSMVYH
ncbi:MAG: hypothetical protein ACTSX0_13350 [Promethearchaeota archaeon]